MKFLGAPTKKKSPLFFGKILVTCLQHVEPLGGILKGRSRTFEDTINEKD